MNKYKNHELPFEGRTVEYYTPEFIFEALGTRFDLDVCQPIGGLKHIPAEQYYTEIDDGLLSPWSGFVWMNPPYGTSHYKRWLPKFKDHANGIALLPSRTDTKWFHECVAPADAILFIKGRIPFIDGTQTNAPGNCAAFGSLLVGYGDKAVEAMRKAGDMGFLYIRESA